MDGVVNPLLSSVSRYDIWVSAVSSQFLTYCQIQVECNQHFSVDQPPQIMLYNILTELDANRQKCVNDHFTRYQLTSDRVRDFLFGMIQSAEQYMDRTVIPAVIVRLNRCNGEDVTVLTFLFRKTLGTANQIRNLRNSPGFIYSRVLNYNIVQSERWLALNESEIDKKTMVAWHKSAIMAPEIPTQYIALRSQWPKYPLRWRRMHHC
jgi:hypothetical protein